MGKSLRKQNLCTVFKDTGEAWDEKMHDLYKRHGIENSNALAEATGIPRSTIYASNAYESPHGITVELALRICKALGENLMDVWTPPLDLESCRAYEETFSTTMGRLADLVESFLRFAPEQQENVTRALSAIVPYPRSADDEFVCFMLAEHFSEMANATHPWDFDDDLLNKFEERMEEAE